MDELVLQSIIGTDPKNPLLSVLKVKGSNELHVYFGAQFLEAIPSNRDHINFRAAVGRLYNAGLSRKKLVEVFQLDRKTIQRWGKALLLDDCEETIRILSGRGPLKVDVEIRRFIEVRYSLIYKRNKYSYNKEIREDVLSVYNMHLCSETIRKVIISYKNRLALEGKKEEEPVDLTTGKNDIEKDTEDEPESLSDNLSCCVASAIPNTHPFGKKNILHIHHAGILIFSWWIQKISALLEDGGHILSQWVVTILLEAVNIEQTKYLDFTSLSLLLGKTYRLPITQRYYLDEMSTESSYRKLLQFNGELINVDSCDDYYYDPHTKHYTGTAKILKGWCPCIRFADKALHSDMIHTSAGNPVYMEHCDNYSDLRERYKKVLTSFRDAVGIPTDRRLTIIFDRGIYSMDVIQEIKKNLQYELITWEKGFKNEDKWSQSKNDGHFTLVRHHNSSRDRRLYHFYYHDELWDKDASIRRLIVHAVNPDEKTITVSILCTDTMRDPESIIVLMFKRWLQENDFKYLNKHFGINQITSYDTVDYDQLREELEDKKVLSADHEALVYERKKTNTALKNLLHKKHVLVKKINAAQKELDMVEQQMEDISQKTHTKISTSTLKELKKVRRSLKAKLGQWSKMNIDKKIKPLDDALEIINNNLSQVEKNTSKIDHLIENNYKRLDTRKKQLMDTIKILARNIFYHSFDFFKNTYDNLRDDHAYFRNLTHADGFMIEHENEIEILLNPTAHLQPKIRTIMEQVLEQINKENIGLPNGTNKIMRLKLVPKEGMRLAS